MWWWVLIWVSLFLVGGIYLASCAWALWGQVKELGSELAAAERRLEAVQGQLEQLGEQVSSPQQLAVFADPATARKERERLRETGRRARRQRRAGSHPAWAKHVD